MPLKGYNIQVVIAVVVAVCLLILLLLLLLYPRNAGRQHSLNFERVWGIGFLVYVPGGILLGSL